MGCGLRPRREWRVGGIMSRWAWGRRSWEWTVGEIREGAEV
jgi:hypothetical protein